jgi:Alw26I/Eco31I/Esp3I family type II restriction m6 adenine DNA methyltransferase
VSHGLNEIAVAVLDGLHQHLEGYAESPLEMSEAIRLASLTYVLSSVKRDSEYSFSHLSYEAEKSHVSQSRVSKLSKELLEMFTYPIPEGLDTDDLVRLLGLIYSYGCYSLPRTYNRGTSRKPLGAFFTPPDLADYIISKTLSPILGELASSASIKGLSSLQKMLSLKTLDPACGTGVFLVSAMHVFMNAMKTGIKNAIEGGVSRRQLRNAGILDFPQAIRRNMFGVDIDSGALEVTDISLRLLSQTSPGNLDISGLGRSLKQGNSIISLRGLNGNADHTKFFSDAGSRIPFEWYREFSEILDNGGFDFIVMNPPYERLKPNLAEFLRERLLTGERDIHLDDFSKHRERLCEDVNYFRESGEYHLGNMYTIDTHRLFIERAIQLTAQNGTIGFVVPSTILGDLSSRTLRKSIIAENCLLGIDEFSENSRLFDDVTQSVSVVTLKRGGNTRSFLVRFGLNDLKDTRIQVPIEISATKIERTFRQSFTIPHVDKVGWNLLSKLHDYPSIGSINSLVVRRGELDLTLNRDCITTYATDFRLIRGSNISRYSLHERFIAGVDFVDLQKLRKSLGTSSRANHIGRPRIAGQQVSNRSQRWRLKFASIPTDAILGNSCNYIVETKDSNESKRFYLLGLLNSELMNWRFSLTNTNNHVSIHELMQLPIPSFDTPVSDSFKSLLIKGVKQHKTNRTSPRIESTVFALYGFSTKEAQTVLAMRSTPESEASEILHELDTLIS